jgi:hypothetical protein
MVNRLIASGNSINGEILMPVFIAPAKSRDLVSEFREEKK